MPINYPVGPYSRPEDLHCSWFRKDISVNMHHEVPTSCILHYKAYMIFGLETGKKVHQKGMPYAVHSFKNSLFTHEAESKNVLVDIIMLPKRKQTELQKTHWKSAAELHNIMKTSEHKILTAVFLST